MIVLQNKIAERAKRLLCFIDPFASLRVRTCLLPCYLKYYTRINLQSQGFISRFLTGVICKSKFQLGVEFSLTNLSIIHYGN